MKDVVLLILGAVLGLVLSESWKLLKLDKLAERLLRQIAVRPLPKSRFGSFVLGNRNTNSCIIDGNGESTIAPEDIVCRFNEEQLLIPDALTAEVKRVERDEKAKEAKSLPHAWNGTMAHIVSFTPSRRSGSEENRLLINLQAAQYFHFVAANVAIHREFLEDGFESPARKRLIGEFSDWRTRVPPNVVNGLPLNLFVLTDDNQLVFSMRSSSVAIGPNEISFAINENLHPDHDRIGDGVKLDIATLIRRALAEEVGWIDKPSSGRVAETRILGFAIHMGYAGYGLFGYARLPITYAELQLGFAMSARDRFETSSLIAKTFDVPTVCEFIHERQMYNFVGMGAYYVMVHEGKRIDAIDREFFRLQSS